MFEFTKEEEFGCEGIVSIKCEAPAIKLKTRPSFRVAFAQGMSICQEITRQQSLI